MGVGLLKCLGERIRNRSYAGWRQSSMVEGLPCTHKGKALAFILSKRKERHVEQKSSILVTRKFQDLFGGILVSLIKQFKNRHRGCSRTR